MADASLITDGFGDSSQFSPYFIIQGFGIGSATPANATLITDAFGTNNPDYSPWVITQGYRSSAVGANGTFRCLFAHWIGGGGSTGITPTPVVEVDTHDGFDGKHHRKKRDQKERLHNQLEQAFLEAFKGPEPVAPLVARRNDDEPYEPFIFPAYRDQPIDEDDDEAAWLLLSS